MLNRREFLGSTAIPACAIAAGAASALQRGATGAPQAAGASGRAPALAALGAMAGDARDAGTIARDEDFWFRVQQAFTVDRSVVNLNNGGVSPSPAIVQDAQRRHQEFCNTLPPPRALWTLLEPQREGVRERLARGWGVSAEEIALTRNASESLQICQLGFDLEPGDEVLTTTVDYPRMITTFKQRERRDGIVLRQFKVPIPCEDHDAIVRLFAENITPRTRLILMSHVVNITGQIMPVKEVVAMARTRNRDAAPRARRGRDGAGEAGGAAPTGIPVIVDGAHAFAHMDYRLSDLECDYYGVSLHKWLAAPHGTGLLYVRRERIRDLWPMMAAGDSLAGDIRKFEEIGTHPVALTRRSPALTLHETIGGARKEARLRYLRDRWAQRLLDSPLGRGRVRLHTSLKPAFSCGIATMQVDGIDSARLAEWLIGPAARHHILVTAIKHDEFEGIRVTPNVYTTLEEIDRFTDAIEQAMRDGLPS
ncbi:MAG: aminotransferase class V-fold PLP-dependent enzyme [Phycisphaerales bacterium]